MREGWALCAKVTVIERTAEDRQDPSIRAGENVLPCHSCTLEAITGMELLACYHDQAVEKSVIRLRNGEGIVVKAEGMSWMLFFQIARAIPSAVTAAWNGPVDGMTALHVAADNLRPEYCRVLLARGADPNAADFITGNTPLHVIVRDRSNFLQIFPLESGLTPKLCSNDEVPALEKEVILTLLRGAARMDSRNRIGETPVEYAVTLGRAEIVRFLLSAAKGCSIPGWTSPGEDFVVANAEGSLLDRALKLERYDVVEALCGFGVRFEKDPTRLPLRWGKRRFPTRIDELLTPLGL